MNDINKKLQTSSATNYSLSDQDFGEPKQKKTEKNTPKRVYIREDSNVLKCKACGKRSYIPTAPITETVIMYCSCGKKLAVLAGRDYGDKQRKIQAEKLKNQPPIEEIPTQII